jgi:hypothetical protein
MGPAPQSERRSGPDVQAQARVRYRAILGQSRRELQLLVRQAHSFGVSRPPIRARRISLKMATSAVSPLTGFAGRGDLD